MPLWIGGTWVGGGYELSVKYAVDTAVFDDINKCQHVYRAKHTLVRAVVDHTYTREERVNILQALVDMVAMCSGLNCVIAGGPKKLERRLKPRRRERK